MVERGTFGRLADGTPVAMFRVANRAGLDLRAIAWGGIIVSLRTTDRHGEPGDVVLGHDELAPYFDQAAYLGSIVGRHANRIAHARFALDGRTYHLAPNEPPHHLHGGRRGFHEQLWDAAEVRTAEGDGVLFTRVSSDGEEGYPGRLRVRVRYLVTQRNELRIDYEARTSAPTVVSLTQHSYFNLACQTSDDVLGHELMLDADAYTPVDDAQIPTGEIADVGGTPFDFRTPRAIGERIDASHEQLRIGGGYDHNWALRSSTSALRRAAWLFEPTSGRMLEVLTTEPGLQVYAGNRLDGSIVGRNGRRYGRRAGLCLETQRFPDGPNQPRFPSAVLRPDEVFRSLTVYRFGCGRPSRTPFA